MKITSKVHELVRPEDPSPGGVLSLSNLDQIMLRVYARFLLVFSSSNKEQVNEEKSEQVPVSQSSFMSPTHLKASLSTALTIFYPLAGRFKLLPNQGLQIDCCNAGAEFYEATVDGKLEDFESLADAKLRVFKAVQEHDSRFEILSPCGVAAAKDITEAPLLSIQATKFSCGSVTLVLAIHHNAADGLAMSNFVKAWSQISAGKSHLVEPPSFDRSLLNPSVVPSPKFEHIEYQTGRPHIPAPTSQSKSYMLEFRKHQLEARMNTTGLAGKSPANHHQLLVAHIWRSVTKARGLNPDEQTKLGFSVNVRGRLSPPLPDNFFGNAVCFGLAVSKVHDLLSNPLAYAVNLLQEAQERMTHKYIKSLVDWIEQQDSPLKIFPACFDPKADFAVSSWITFPLYKADFGWGEPLFVGMAGAMVPGLAILLPSPSEETMTALLGLSAEDLDKLLADPEFLSFKVKSIL